MINEINLVKKFHEAMGLTVNTVPSWPIINDANLRLGLMKEELKEVQEEIISENKDISKLTSEIADLLVVTFGTIVTYGLQDVITPVFDEIMKSNFSKLDDNGRPIINGQNGVLDESRSLGKVLKGPNWKPADVSHIFKD